jgi:hypothetical protein
MTRRHARLALALAAGTAVVLPVPPIPPAGGPADGAAPVPNLSLEAPDAGQPDTVRLAPTFFSLPQYNASQGFPPGSRIQELPGHRDPLRAGFTLSVPLQ